MAFDIETIELTSPYLRQTLDILHLLYLWGCWWCPGQCITWPHVMYWFFFPIFNINEAHTKAWRKQETCTRTSHYYWLSVDLNNVINAWRYNCLLYQNPNFGFMLYFESIKIIMLWILYHNYAIVIWKCEEDEGYI